MKMRHSLIVLAIIVGIFIVTTSCKLTDGAETEKLENVTKVSEGNSLSAAGKRASIETQPNTNPIILKTDYFLPDED